MKYTAAMWDVETDEGEALGYIELVASHYSATTPAGFGCRFEFESYAAAGEWLASRADPDAPEEDRVLVIRPNALTNPNE